MTTFKITERQGDHTPALCREDTGVEQGLYMVTYTYTDGKVTPYTTTVYVLAQDEQSAISQGSDLALGPFRPCITEASVALEDGRLTATATRIPFLIRGWGRSTF